MKKGASKLPCAPSASPTNAQRLPPSAVLRNCGIGSALGKAVLRRRAVVLHRRASLPPLVGSIAPCKSPSNVGRCVQHIRSILCGIRSDQSDLPLSARTLTSCPNRPRYGCTCDDEPPASRAMTLIGLHCCLLCWPCQDGKGLGKMVVRQGVSSGSRKYFAFYGRNDITLRNGMWILFLDVIYALGTILNEWFGWIVTNSD